MKVEVDVPSLILHKVSLDVEQTLNETIPRAQELYEGRGSRPGLPIPNSLYGLYEGRANTEWFPRSSELRSCVKVEVDVLGSLVRTLCGRRANAQRNYP